MTEAAMVVGVEGVIGRALWQAVRTSGRSVVTTSQVGGVGTLALDLAADAASFPIPLGTRIAYLCGAVTDLRRCDRAPAESAAVNVTGTVALAARLVDAGVFVLFPSTNLVFDGSVERVTADSPVNPLTTYGRQKAEAERRLLAMGDSVAVLRLTKVVHAGWQLLREWCRALLAGEPIYPFYDLRFSPLSLNAVVQAALRIGERRIGGIFQFSADRDVSYAEMAFCLANALAVDPDLVQPQSALEAGIPLMRLTPHTTLDGGRLLHELSIPPSSADDTVNRLCSLIAQEPR